MTLLILGLIVVLIIVFRLYTDRFYNPYTLTLIYGKKGCGKSTIAQKLIAKHYKRGWNIYYNEGDSRFKLGTAIDATKMWTYEFKPHSLIIIDEVNLLWDNRQFKTFPKEMAAWFRLQRHYKVKVILFSQTADADKKIRDLTDRVYLCRRYFQVLICCKPFEKEIVYREPKQEGMQSGFMDVYEKRNFGPIGCMFCWLPYWIKTHDSFKFISAEGGEKNDNNNTAHIRAGGNRALPDGKMVRRSSSERNTQKTGKRSSSHADRQGRNSRTG